MSKIEPRYVEDRKLLLHYEYYTSHDEVYGTCVYIESHPVSSFEF